MLSMCSVVKVKALTDEELKHIEGMNVTYLRDNYDSTGYRIFNQIERAEYGQLEDYIKPVHLYREYLDEDKLKSANSIPKDYVIVALNLSKKDHNSKDRIIAFNNDKRDDETVVVLREEEIEAFTLKVFQEYYVAYIEPLQVLVDIDLDIAMEDSGLMRDGFMKHGYFKLSDMSTSLYKLVNVNLEHELNEEIFFHTFESVNLRWAE